MEIALVYDKSGQIDDIGAKSIETAMNILRQPHNIVNRKVLDKRLRILEQSFNAIPTRSPLLPPKLDTRNLFAQRSLSPATTASTSWTPIPEVETSKNDILEAFLSTISDDPYHPSQSLENSGIFSLHSDSPTLPGMMVPTIFDWSNPSSFSDEDNESKTVFGTSPSDVSPTNYPPMFLGSFCSSEETSPENKSFGNYKPDVYGFKESNGGGFQQDGSGDGNSHIHTAPNLFSEESGWAV